MSAGLRQLAETTGPLAPRLPEAAVLSPGEFASCAAGEGGRLLTSPPIDLAPGRYFVLFWFAVAAAAEAQVSFEAVPAIEDEEEPLAVGHSLADLGAGAARTAAVSLDFGLDADADILLRALCPDSLRLLAVDVRMQSEPLGLSGIDPAPGVAPPPGTPIAPFEAVALGSGEALEFWLALPSESDDSALVTLGAEAGAHAIELSGAAAAAQFRLDDGRRLLVIPLLPRPGLPFAGGGRVTVTYADAGVDLGLLDLATANCQADEGAAAERVEIRASHGGAGVAIREIWPDYPIRRVSLDAFARQARCEAGTDGMPQLVVGAAGLSFAAGDVPALRLARHKNGGHCEIRHRGRAIAVDLTAAKDEDILVLPSLEPPLLSPAGDSLPPGAIVHPALRHLFRRMKPAWLRQD